MPANRPHLDRAAKAAQILDVAEALLLRDGFEATTMAAIARGAGVSANAVYWYFPGKDEVLAAVLSRRLEGGLARVGAQPDASFREQVEAGLAQLDSQSNLTAAIHERARHSAAVAEVHEAFHAAVTRFLNQAFAAAGLAEDDARLASTALVAIVEGIHLHDGPRDTAPRDELVFWTIQRFVAGSGDR
jgi:AcrR family transcriptional regulator